MSYTTIKDQSIQQLINIVDLSTWADKDYMQTYPGSHIYDILHTIKGGADDYFVWAHEYSSLGAALADAAGTNKALALVGPFDLAGTEFLINVANTKILGFGAYIYNSGANIDAFHVNADYVTISGSIVIDGGAGYTIDRGIYLEDANYCQISGLKIKDVYKEGVRLAGASYSKQNHFDDIMLTECGRDAASSSLMIYVSDNNTFEKIYSISGGAASHGDFYLVQSDGCHFTDCRVSGAAGYGLEVTTNTYALSWKGGDIGGVQKHGMVFTGGARCCTVAGAMIHMNGQGASNTYDGIILDTAHHINIVDSWIFSEKEPGTADSYQNQRYGINVNAGNHNILHDNHIFNNLTQQIIDNGTDTIIHDNALVY